MRLLVTQGAVSQVYYFDIVEYEIVAYAGTPQQPYWQLLSNGAGIYVANDAIAPEHSGHKLRFRRSKQTDTKAIGVDEWPKLQPNHTDPSAPTNPFFT